MMITLIVILITFFFIEKLAISTGGTTIKFKPEKIKNPTKPPLGILLRKMCRKFHKNQSISKY